MQIAALILAAGRSTRMGEANKLLADWNGQPMISHIANMANKSNATPIHIVTGHQHDKITAALRSSDVSIFHNPNFSEGLSTSLKAGIRSLPKTIDAAIVCLGDMPLIDATILNRLIAAYDPRTNHHICIPTSRRKRGNPVLLGRALFEEIMQTMGDEGAKYIIKANPDKVIDIPVDNDAIHFDIDTIEDLKKKR